MKDTYENIIARLKNREFSPVYFLTGEEPLYIDKISQYIENEIIDEPNRDFNQAVFYAKDTPPDDVIASAKEFPFGVEYRVVIVKEAQNWSKLDVVAKYAENPLQSTILVICYKYSKPKAADIKSFQKNGIVFESPKIGSWQLGGWVEKCAKEHNFNISNASANLLAEYIGNDLTRIDNEFAKLRILFPEDSEITPDIIEKHIGISKQYNVFELQDALATRNEAAAYKIVMAFCMNIKSNPIIVTINSLYGFYNAMLTYHLAEKKSSTEELKAIFGYNKSDKQLQRQARIAMGYSTPSLIQIIATLREFDARCKGIDNVADEPELYKELIYKILHM